MSVTTTTLLLSYAGRAARPGAALLQHGLRNATRPSPLAFRGLSTTAPQHMPSFRDRKRRMMKDMRKMQEKEKKAGSGNKQQEPSKEAQEMAAELRLTRDSPGVIMDPYVPVPKELKPSALSSEGMKLKLLSTKKTASSTVGAALIRRNCPDFAPIDFAETAQEGYLRAHEALFRQDKAGLRDEVTDATYLAMRKQYREDKHQWEFVQEIERPRVVHMVAVNVEDKKNYWAQVTVRLHLELKSLNKAKAEPYRLIEYVVFEAHISRPGAFWKICGKTLPDFLKDEIKLFDAKSK